MRISLNNSNRGYFKIKGSVLEFVGIAVRNRPVEVENVLYTTLQPAARGAELKHGTLVTAATWAHCCLCVPQLQPQLEDAKYNRAAREALK